MSSARTPSAVGREALESSSPGFQPSAIPSQLPTRFRTGVMAAPHTTKPIKKARCRCDTGLLEPYSRKLRPSVTSAGDAGVYFLREMFLAGRNIPHRCYLGSNLAVSESLTSGCRKGLLMFRAVVVANDTSCLCLLDAGRHQWVHNIFKKRFDKVFAQNPLYIVRDLVNSPDSST